jgi:hypothetical protein
VLRLSFDFVFVDPDGGGKIVSAIANGLHARATQASCGEREREKKREREREKETTS